MHTHVDTAQLGDVHADLQGLLKQLDGLDTLSGGAGHAELGGADAADAVADFVHGWSTERHHLVDHLRDCTRYIEQAVHDYTETEQSLRCAVPTTGSGTTAGNAP